MMLGKLQGPPNPKKRRKRHVCYKKSWAILNWVTKLKKSVIAPVGYNFKRFPFEFREITTKANENSKKKQANRLDRRKTLVIKTSHPFCRLHFLSFEASWKILFRSSLLPLIYIFVLIDQYLFLFDF